MSRPPTWRGALNRAAIAAAVFAVLVVLIFKQSVAQGAALAAAMLLIYIPLGIHHGPRALPLSRARRAAARK